VSFPSRHALVFGTAILAAGCAGVSAEKFDENPGAASDFAVCRSLADSAGNAAFASKLRFELARRQMHEGTCPAIIAKREKNVAAGIIAGIAVVAVAAAARSNGGPYAGVGADYSPAYEAPVRDWQWEWDEYYNKSYQLVWSCRGVQTGQFTELSYCGTKLRADTTWPAKTAY
jgi:hypothetical protein